MCLDKHMVSHNPSTWLLIIISGHWFRIVCKYQPLVTVQLIVWLQWHPSDYWGWILRDCTPQHQTPVHCWGSATMSALEKNFLALPDCNIGGTFPKENKNQVQQACFNRCVPLGLGFWHVPHPVAAAFSHFCCHLVQEWRDGVRVKGMMYLASGDIERVGYLNASCQQCMWSISKIVDRADPAGVSFPFQIGISIRTPWFLQTSQAKLYVRTSWWDESASACTLWMFRKDDAKIVGIVRCASSRKAPRCLAQVSPVFPTSTETGLANIGYRWMKRSIKTHDKWFHKHSAFTVQSKFGEDIAALDLVLTSICASFGPVNARILMDGVLFLWQVWWSYQIWLEAERWR